METKVLIMRPDEPNEGRTVELPRRPTYDQLAAIVRPLLGVDWFEHVAVLADFRGGLAFQRADMFVDEMGIRKICRATATRPRSIAATRFSIRA